MHKFSFIFFGSPRLAELILAKLLRADHIPVAVVCNPDRPVGRKMVLTPPSTKVLAQAHHIPVLQFDKIGGEEAQQLKGLITGETIGIVAAYAQILPPSLISLFPKGIVGVHPSLLPLYRGSTPIQSALLDGVEETGVSLYCIDEKMDHGNILFQSNVRIEIEDNYVSLEEKLALLGADMLMQKIPEYLSGNLIPQEQDHSKATFTKKIRTEDGFVDIRSDDPLSIFRKIQALAHAPGVYMVQDGKRIKLLSAEMRDGSVVITRMVEEGKKPVACSLRIGT